MAKFLSGRQRNIQVGVSSYTESQTSLEVIGKVGIGTTVAQAELNVIGGVVVSGIVTAQSFSGNIEFANTSGIATYASNAGIATYAVNAGIATYASNAGIATYADNAGIATNVIGGISSVTELNVSGVSTLTTLNLTSFTASGVSTVSSTVLDLAEYLRHQGDTDTFVRFLTDRILINAGGENLIDIFNDIKYEKCNEVIKINFKNY